MHLSKAIKLYSKKSGTNVYKLKSNHLADGNSLEGMQTVKKNLTELQMYETTSVKRMGKRY